MEYAKHLAYSSKPGVFDENQDLLGDPVAGIMQSENVVSVHVFTLKGTELIGMKGPDNGLPVVLKDINSTRKTVTMDSIRRSGLSMHFENDNSIEFWSPVVSASQYFKEETLYFENNSFYSGKNNVIGFVRIVMTMELLNASIREIILRSILMMSIFMVLGWVVIRFIVMNITKPLGKLTERFIAMGAGYSVEKVNIETEDEIGKLGVAFNNMVDSLREADIAKQKIEEQLRHAQKMEAIGTLAGGIAHDCNNTLSTIMGYGQLLKKRLHDDTSDKYLDNLLSSAQKSGSFIHSLLAFSRKEVSNPSPHSLNIIISDLEEILMRLIGEDINLKVEFSVEELIILTEKGQIEQVLMNLASNARDAMPDGGLLTISARSVKHDNGGMISSHSGKAGEYALISIQDTGMGMEGQTIERAFEPFFTTKEIGKGTGLGLSMVYGIITQHKGYIAIRSEPGSGTVVEIYLPLSSQSVLEIDQVLKMPVRGTETVLIAEDNSDFRGLVKVLLEQNGYRVIEAENGDDAVEKFTENMNEVRFLLLDIVMPKKNGQEVYAEIKKKSPDIKVLFMSGYSSEELDQKGCAGDNSILLKPVMADDLLMRVRELLDG
ncbi:MAG: ATP-binding protein [Nitrospirota bacterium]